MQVVGLKAEPDPQGGSILLTWTNPSDATLAGIKILRREFTLPVIPEDFGSSFEIHDDPTARPGVGGRFRDTGAPRSSLRGETIYYYAVVARDSGAGQFPTFVSAMATSPFQSGSYLYENLPGIYRTYDTSTQRMSVRANCFGLWKCLACNSTTCAVSPAACAVFSTQGELTGICSHCWRNGLDGNRTLRSHSRSSATKSITPPISTERREFPRTFARWRTASVPGTRTSRSSPTTFFALPSQNNWLCIR